MRTVGFALADWQVEALDAWEAGADRGPRAGTLEVFTGGGKTLIALAAVARVAQERPDLRLAIVVPTEALALQWISSLLDNTTLREDDVGLLGAGSSDSLDTKRALVSIVNSAAKVLPEMASKVDPDSLMLIVDECHRAGAPSFSRVLRTEATYRLGLSATPGRDEIGADGEPLEFDEQLVGRLLGPVVFSFSLRDARDIGWLPNYEIHHHAVRLLSDERRNYDDLTRRIDDVSDQLKGLGAETSQARQLASRGDEVGSVARTWVALTSKRKDLLYRARERGRVAARITRDAFAQDPQARALLFHERIDEAVDLYRALQDQLADVSVDLEHSRLRQSDRQLALHRFRSGECQVLVSVKSLIEGIDVPEADTGVSVASSSSVRQRIQALGRVLRRPRDAEEEKTAYMHVLYVHESSDDRIYSKEDWSDLTGEAANVYWLWPVDESDRPTRLDGPPHRPVPTEDQELDRIEMSGLTPPIEWLGQWPAAEYSVDTTGTVRNAEGRVIENPQGIPDMLGSLPGRSAGRVGVTPVHRFVLARSADPPRDLMVLGRLNEPLRTIDTSGTAEFERKELAPGQRYPGPTEPVAGEFRIGQKRGGIIERRTRGGKEFALTSGGSRPELETNAAVVLEAWRDLATNGFRFGVNELDDAIYWDGGEPRFLGHVPGGFAWPSDEHASSDDSAGADIVCGTED